MSPRSIFPLIATLLGLAVGARAGAPPNILIILVDDMGYSATFINYGPSWASVSNTPLRKWKPELVRQLDAAWLAWWKDCTGKAWTGTTPREKIEE